MITKKKRHFAAILALMSMLAGSELLAQGATRWKTYVKGPGATWVQGCAYELSARSFTVGQSGATVSVTVTTGSGCTWSVSGCPSWVTPTVNGNVVQLTVGSTAELARYCDVTIAGSKVRICQEGTPQVVSVGPEELIVEGRGGYSFEKISIVGVTTPTLVEWAVSAPDSWITVLGQCRGTQGGIVTILTEPNHTGATRVGSVEVSRKWVRVIQPPAAN